MSAQVVFLFPPQWTAAQPHYGIARLAGQLRDAGIAATAVDLNLEFIESVMTPARSAVALHRLELEKETTGSELAMRMALGADPSDLKLPQQKLAWLSEYATRWTDFVRRDSDRWPTLLADLRNPQAFYDPARLVDGLRAIDRALELHSAPYYPLRLAWNNFSHPTIELNLDEIVKHCSSLPGNPYAPFFKTRVEELAAKAPDLFAISIGSFSQVLPGLTLASMLKRRLDANRREDANGDNLGRSHISIGGNFFTRLKDAIIARPSLFTHFCDSITVGEGEHGIVQLARAAAKCRTSATELVTGDPEPTNHLSKVPGLLYPDPNDGRLVVANPEAKKIAMTEMAFADYGVFALDRYLAPDRVVCLRASKGCYWGNCTFCDSYYGLADDRLGVDRLIEEIRHLRSDFGIRHIEFVDQCIEPVYLDEMSSAFRKAKLDASWCNARTEKGIDTATLANMEAAGATMIMWGVETGSQRLLRLMKKGISTRDRMRVLRASSDAGLWNFAYVFFGFPTETREEAFSTIDLIANNTDIIHAYGCSVFTLGKHSPLMEDPERVGIITTICEESDFSSNMSFEVDRGLGSKEVSEVIAICSQRCRDAYSNPLWMALRTRENLHLYVAKHGRDFVRDFDLGDALKQLATTGDDFVS